jgi:hypothetical protein
MLLLFAVTAPCRAHAADPARTEANAPIESKTSLDAEPTLAAVAYVGPTKRLPLAGTCATGTGVTDVTPYGISGDSRIAGAGLSLGVSGHVDYALDKTPRATRYPIALYAGAAASVGILSMRVPVGFDAVTTALCARVQADAETLRTTASSAVWMHLPIELGLRAELDRASSTSLVFRMGWAPSFYLLRPADGDGAAGLAWRGAALSVSRADSGPQSATPPVQLRLFVAPPGTSTPLIVTLGFGVGFQ